MRHAPFGRPRHPLGTFPCGKVPRPPAGGRNLSQETNSLRKAEKGPFLLFPYHRGFRLCGGDQGAFRSPPGPLRGPSLYAWAKPPTRHKLLAEGRKRVYLSFTYHKGFRLCGGDQRAFRSPFGNLRPFAASRNLYIKQLSCGRQEKGLPFFSRIAKGFASAEATKGLSGRPLETFGPLLQCKIGICKKAFSCCRQETGLPFFRIAEKNFPINKANLPQDLTPCGRQIIIIISPIP